MTKAHREFCRAVERLGLRVLSTRITGRNHLCARITNGQRAINYVIPGTASDWRGMRNALAEISRYFKET